MRIEVYTDKAGEPRWRAVDDNERIIATSGEGYANKAECEADLALLALGLRGNARVVDVGEDGGTVTGSLAALLAQKAAKS
jgi:uncharacterized protein YegP (UPF0339 family)